MKKRTVHFIVSSIITLMLVYAVSREVSLEEFLSIFSRTDKRGVLLFAALSITSLFFRAARYGWLIEDCSEGDKAPAFASLVVVTAMRNAFVDFLPLRLGESVWFYAMNRYGVPLLRGTAVFGLCLLYDVLVIFLMLSLFAAHEILVSGAHTGLFGGRAAFLAGAVSLGCVAFVWSIVSWAHLLVRRISILLSRLKEKQLPQILMRFFSFSSEQTAQLSIQLERASRAQSLRILLASIVLRFLKYFSLYVLLISVVGYWGIGVSNLSLLRTTVAFLAGEAAASLPISGFMGFGAYEGAWSMVFSGIGGSLPAITSVIFAVHIITQVVGYFWGILAGAVFLSSQLAKDRR